LPLEELVYPPDGLKHRLLTETPVDELRRGLMQTLRSMRAAGTTFFSDFREGGVAGISLLEEVAAAERFACQILGRPGEPDTEQSMLSHAEIRGLGLPSLDGITREALQSMQEFKIGEEKTIAWHLAERRREEEFLALTERFPPSFIVHATHLTEPELERLAEKDVGIVFCPRSNFALAAGVPPLLSALQKNIKVALGTDNVMVGDPDLFRELEFANRIIRLDAEGKKVPPEALLELVTAGAARVLGVQRDRGWLAEGKWADFFLVDLRAPNLHCQSQNFITCLINRVRSENVHQVYQAGVKVLDKRNAHRTASLAVP
jgi:cytosine/adenosine deaminase-related metal-dependent hydrolase